MTKLKLNLKELERLFLFIKRIKELVIIICLVLLHLSPHFL